MGKEHLDKRSGDELSKNGIYESIPNRWGFICYHSEDGPISPEGQRQIYEMLGPITEEINKESLEFLQGLESKVD